MSELIIVRESELVKKIRAVSEYLAANDSHECLMQLAEIITEVEEIEHKAILLDSYNAKIIDFVREARALYEKK